MSSPYDLNGIGEILRGETRGITAQLITRLGAENRKLQARIAELEAHIAALEEAAEIEEWDDFPNFPEPPEVK